MKPSSQRFIKVPIGLDYSPKEFQKRKGKNRWSNSYNDSGDYAPRQVAQTGIILPLVDNFLKGRGGMSHGDKMLTSPDITQRTVSWTLLP